MEVAVTHQSQRRHKNTVRSRRVKWQKKNPKVREGGYKQLVSRRRVDHSLDRCVQPPKKTLGLGLGIVAMGDYSRVAIWQGTGALV